MIKDGITGLLFEVGSSYSLAECMKKVLGNPGMLVEFRKKQESVKGIEEDAREIIRIYNELS